MARRPTRLEQAYGFRACRQHDGTAGRSIARWARICGNARMSKGRAVAAEAEDARPAALSDELPSPFDLGVAPRTGLGPNQKIPACTGVRTRTFSQGFTSRST